MTPSEKRFYKLNFGQSEGKFSALYDVINKMEVYDEALVRKQIGGNSKNLKVHKVQLTELILKSLTLFHRKKSAYSKIRIGLEEIDLLIDKELYEMAADRLKRLKKLCLEYEEYAYLLEITDREFRINHIQFDKIGQTVKPIYERLRNYIAIMDEQYKYAELGNEVLEQKRQYELSGYPDEVVQYCQRLLDEDFLQQSFKPRSFYGEIYRNNLMVFLNDVIGNKQTSRQFRQASADLFRSNPQFAQHHSFDYLNTLRNLVNIHTQEGAYDQAEAIIEEARNFAMKNNIQREQMVYFFYSELVIAYEKRNFQHIKEKIEARMIAHLEQYDICHDRIGLVTFLYLAIVNLLLNKHEKVQRYLRELHNASRDLQSYFSEIYTIVELISHYYSQEYTLLKNLTSTKLRKLVKNERRSLFYHALLQLFKQLANQPFEAGQAAGKLRSQLPNFRQDQTLGLFRYFHLETWLSALANNRPFLDEMKIANKKA